MVGNNKERLDKILAHFEDFSISLREKITQNILGEFYCYSSYYLKENTQKVRGVPTDFQRSFALRIVKDRGESMMTSAICVLSKIRLDEHELESFQELFKRKNANNRESRLARVS